MSVCWITVSFFGLSMKGIRKWRPISLCRCAQMYWTERCFSVDHCPWWMALKATYKLLVYLLQNCIGSCSVSSPKGSRESSKLISWHRDPNFEKIKYRHGQFNFTIRFTERSEGHKALPLIDHDADWTCGRGRTQYWCWLIYNAERYS